MHWVPMKGADVVVGSFFARFNLGEREQLFFLPLLLISIPSHGRLQNGRRRRRLFRGEVGERGRLTLYHSLVSGLTNCPWKPLRSCKSFLVCVTRLVSERLFPPSLYSSSLSSGTHCWLWFLLATDQPDSHTSGVSLSLGAFKDNWAPSEKVKRNLPKVATGTQRGNTNFVEFKGWIR